jgi:DNA polymerase-3 subunit beta
MACQLVSAAVSARTTIPALKNIKATVHDDALLLVAYDPTQGVGIRYELRGVTVARAGSCVLPKDQLIQILRESTDPDISLDAGKDAVVAKASGEYEMPSLDVDEFPDIPTFDHAGRDFVVSAGTLHTLIKRTAFAADKKDTTANFALTGVLLEAEGETTRLVATDTKRLAVCEHREERDRGASVRARREPDTVKAVHLVPLKTIEVLKRALTDDDELVRIGLRTNDALFQTERAMIYTSLVQGKFPPYRDIIAKTRKEATPKVKIRLPVDSFLARVRQAAIMTDEKSMRVDMTFEGDRVTMKARGAKTGSSEVSLELPEHRCPRTEIAFDPSYLIEFLRALEGEPTVTLEMSTGSRAALFKCGDQYSYLMMPLTAIRYGQQ